MNINNKLVLFLIFITVTGIFCNGLILEELDVSPELYETTVRNILEKRIYLYSEFGNFEKVIDNLNKLKKIFPENNVYYDYRIREALKLKKNKTNATHSNRNK